MKQLNLITENFILNIQKETFKNFCNGVEIMYH